MGGGDETPEAGVTEGSRNELGAEGEPSAEPRAPSGGPTAYRRRGLVDSAHSTAQTGASADLVAR